MAKQCRNEWWVKKLGESTDRKWYKTTNNERMKKRTGGIDLKGE